MNRDLTKEEIKHLSLELKVCYMIFSWNISLKPRNLEDWAMLHEWYLFKNQDHWYTITLAKEKALKYLEFIKENIVLKG